MSQAMKTTVRTVLCMAGGVLFLQDPQAVVRGFQSGMQLCMNTVLPALFPFFVVCGLLPEGTFSKGPLQWFAKWWGLRTPDAPLLVLLSWLGGYAVCARMIGQRFQEKRLPSRDAALVMLLGCCSGPGFVVGCMGGLLLGNLRLGVLLYGLQIAANLISTIPCLPFLPKQTAENPVPNVVSPAKKSLSQAISAAVDSSLQVCGCVIFFRVVSAVMLPFIPDRPLAQAGLSAVLEISAGSADFAALGGKAALYGGCFCLSMLGLSVWAQLSLLMRGAFSIRLLVFQRFLHWLILAGLTRALAPLLPGIATVYSTLSDRVIPMNRLPLDAFLLVFLFLGTVLYKVRQNFYNR